MKSHILLSSPVLFLAFFLQAMSLAHGHYSDQHWYEPREQHVLSAPENARPMPSLIIDTFQNPTHNDLGFWHGAGEDLAMQYQPGSMQLFPTDPDQNYHTQFETNGCFSMIPWRNQFLHVEFVGTDQFTVSLNEHNEDCYPHRAPFPGVPDSIEASRYMMKMGHGSTGHDGDGHEHDEPIREEHGKKQISKDNGGGDEDDQTPAAPPKKELFIPLSHFLINQNRVVSVSFSGFYTNRSITLHRVEIVSSVPPPRKENNYFKIPEKLPTGELILRCTRPKSFAFGIDDGSPRFAQEVMRILDEENVRVTFFAVGAGLRDTTTNLTRFYREMLKKGHQVALHSNTHPKMEALPTIDKIDNEIIQAQRTLKEQLGIESSYFRPPFGTVGARMRQQIAKYIPNAYIVNWSVDVEDWLWADSSTPEKQLDAFYRSVARGGNLAVMHFLNPTTVGYLRQFIRHVKGSGFKIMRIDQCMEDPDSPPLS
ncbi:Glycoside hydrolase/deacetylase beta/alpha-barrel [Penicillium atrosanguineum]|uniref:Glycoside hydrolase/deacetylase beta/alpha-barrel n=1 Tax=Penicillium atrosanguineum TaxID=1132637 RepID=A0A9W9TZW5_9EURO|nr:Glycoside hydrolase/deacetylase beta/alpha-barrel [Penicillium atrosanguineum]KAJ5299748.1 Glycoside hydrolase/deacetylase beta/alpha-barrel [Penicillium atrosanguineum]